MMIVREVLPEEKNQFNALANHPLQSWEWGEFREKAGKTVIRLGVFDPEKKGGQEKLKSVYQLTVHPIPHINYSVLYFPRGPMPDKTMIEALKKLAEKERAVLVKLDPNVSAPVNQNLDVSAHRGIHDFLLNHNSQKAKPFWFEYTSLIDLKKSQQEILENMHSKTRYNIRLAERHQVKVIHDNSKKAFDTYLKLMMETTKRQNFYAHTPDYHQKLWSVLKPAGMAHLLLAKYQNQTLAAWMFFIFKKTLYYPYGGSSNEHREAMPTYAMMWEAIKFGQKMECETFDLWGCLGPNPNPKDPWFGFHRFKAGFNGQLVKFLGAYDLVTNPQLYSLYNLADQARWQYLRLKSKIFL